nr:putative C4-dicarboxylate transporter/malic acid transport protein [uncultured bacterium]
MSGAEERQAGRWRPATLARLDPGYFALTMATGIVSTAVGQAGHQHLSGVLLVVSLGCFAVLLVCYAWRAAAFPHRMLADLRAPERAFAFLTFVAACDVLAVRLAADGHHGVTLALVVVALPTWFMLGYGVPMRLIAGSRAAPVLAGVNGTWFMWVVGTQSLAAAVAVLERALQGPARPEALVAVLLWSVGVVLYLLIATLVLVRLLLIDVGPDDLAPPYWVAMGATAITVFAAAHVLHMADSPVLAAIRPAVAGLAVVLWAFGTWLIPMLVMFAVWGSVRTESHRSRLRYHPALWSAVFPLGMYAAASIEVGTALGLPLVQGIGRIWVWVAATAWAFTAAAMIGTVLRWATSLRRARRS